MSSDGRVRGNAQSSGPIFFCNRTPSSPQRLTQHLQTRVTRPTQGCSARLDFRSQVDNKHYATTVPQRLERAKVQFWSIMINSSCGKVRLNLWTKNVADGEPLRDMYKKCMRTSWRGPPKKNTIVVDLADMGRIVFLLRSISIQLVAAKLQQRSGKRNHGTLGDMPSQCGSTLYNCVSFLDS